MKKAEDSAITAYLPLDEIRVDTNFNCRGDDVTPASVYELAQDIKKNGLLQPVVVGPVESDGKRLLIAGYRRMMAHKVLKRVEISCLIRDDLVDHNKLLLMNLRENVQRVDLNIVQEAKALSKLFDLGLTEEAVAKELNKSRGWVQIRNMVRLLPSELHPQMIDGTFSSVNIRELYSSLINDTREVFIEKVLWLKERKSKGHKGATLKDKQAKELAKIVPKIRSKSELFELQERIQRSLCIDHFSAKVLAWAAGEINSNELEEAFNKEIELFNTI